MATTEMKKKKDKNKNKKHKGPASKDRHKLYEMSVQSSEADVEFFDRVYEKKNGKLPTLLKEDFCGTAGTSAAWVKERPGNRAIGVDLDEPTLQWGQENNINPLGNDASRVELKHANVLEVQDPKVDVVAGVG